MAYVGITVDGSMFWGAGVDEDIIKASIGALVVAVNHYLATKADSHVKDERYIATSSRPTTRRYRLQTWLHSST